MGVWPAGYFRRLCTWLLQNRREVAGRVSHIFAEFQRIGFVRVLYRDVEKEDGTIEVTEEPVGFSITEGSSLTRLLQAYVAVGGNPLDVSMFLQPDSSGAIRTTEDDDTIMRWRQPQEGVAAPQTVEYNSPVGETDDTGYGPYRGGWIRLHGYNPARQRGRAERDAYDTQTVIRTMTLIRGWANQDIRTRLQDMEWRILKLCDLREQLTLEVRGLVEAFGDSIEAIEGLDNSDEFLETLRITPVMTAMWKLLYEETDTAARSYRPKSDTVPLLGYTFDDAAPEVLFRCYS